MSHQRIATVQGPASIQACTGLADLVEVRLDASWKEPPGEDAATRLLVECLEAADAAGLPLLATLRPKRQGGAFDGPEDVRINLLLAAAKAGFEWVDLEADHLDMGPLAHALGQEAKVILSDHRLPDVPTREQGMLRLLAMQDLPGTFEKLAFPTGSFMDSLRCAELAHQHRARHGEPVISPIGADAATRALLALAGNQATYGHAPGDEPAVPGQPSAQEIQETWDHWGLQPQELGCAGWYAVLGDPVAHSLSPKIHNAMLRADGVVQRYGALRVPDSIGAFRLVCSIAGRIGLLGASVTAPLKGHAADATHGDDTVKATRAANCLRFEHGKAHSTNTDASAMRRLLDGAKSVAVLGAGGAARAAAWAAKDLGAELTVISRQEVDWAPWKPWGSDVDADALVQATPLGRGDPVPPGDFTGIDHLIELVYKQAPTPLQEAVQCKVTDGRQFLIEQAIDAYSFMTGRTANRGVMEAALA